MMRSIFQLIITFLFIMSVNTAVAADVLNVKIACFCDESGMAAMGAKQGLDEANLQGDFLGQKYSLEFLDPETPKKVSDVTAILATMDESGLKELAKLNPDVPVINLTNEADSLREKCISNLFHTIPSERMRADAVAQWKQKHPESKAVAANWNSDFRKYAASQVNKRFKDLHEGTPMDDQSYSGWIAVKILSDAVVRTGSNDGKTLIPFFKTDLVVDGAKGLKMTFRETGQLRQMLLLVEDGKVVGEAPVRGVVDTTNLDSLGILECSGCKEK